MMKTESTSECRSERERKRGTKGGGEEEDGVKLEKSAHGP
jgi:hypothetical protein